MIIDLYTFLCNKNEYVLSKQVLRSGTSIGAIIEEAQAAQLRKDFMAKMSKASKEARETLYWLKLLKESDYLAEYYNQAKIFSPFKLSFKPINKNFEDIKNYKRINGKVTI